MLPKEGIDISRIRKIYMLRLIGRVLVFLAAAAVFFLRPETFSVLEGYSFFKTPSLLHLLWIVWMLDMLHQLLPAKNNLALGSKKLFRQYFRSVREKLDLQKLKQYILSTTRSAYRIMILWAMLICSLGVLHETGILSDAVLLMVSILFYVCDLICVLVWCPFRLLLKNRCCTTCRIFNWITS